MTSNMIRSNVQGISAQTEPIREVEMTTAETESKPESTEGNGRKTGGERGPREWKEKPTSREKILTQNLSQYIKKETGRDVSPETVRAVRHCLPRWAKSDETTKLRETMDKRMEKIKLQDKREKALAMLREAESELKKFAGTNELDEEEDEDEAEEAEAEAEYSDDATDSDDEEDVFGDTSEKVEADFS